MKGKTKIVLGVVITAAILGTAATAMAGSTAGSEHHAGSGHGSDTMGHHAGCVDENPLFQSLDADKDGTLTKAEAEDGMERLRASHDVDKDNRLSRTEFDAMFAEMTQDSSDYPFSVLDADQDGSLSTEEMQLPAKMMFGMQNVPCR